MKMLNEKDGVQNKNAESVNRETVELGKNDTSAETDGNLAEISIKFSITKEKRVATVGGDFQNNTLVYEEGFAKENQTPDSKKDFTPCKRRIAGGPESGVLTGSKKLKVASDDKGLPSRPLTRNQKYLME